MGIKRTVISIADKCTSKVDKKMIEYVSRFVSDDMSDLEKAISIYLCLGDVLNYNPYFALTHDYKKTNMVRNINTDNKLSKYKDEIKKSKYNSYVEFS